MKVQLKLSMFLLGVPLIAIILSSIGMVNYVQEELRTLASAHNLKYAFICEGPVHEAGYARITLGLIGLVLLLSSFRKGDRLTWLVLAIIFLYQIPVFILPQGASISGWRETGGMLIHGELPRVLALNLLFPLLFLSGLAISFPRIWRSTASA